MDYSLQTCRGVLPVEITFKDVKSLRLKVFPNTEIRLSVPLNTPEDFIVNFLNQKLPWINKQLELFGQTAAVEKEQSIKSGTSTRILGRQLSIKIIPAARKRIIRDDRWLLIYTTESGNQENIDKQFFNWWQKNSKQYFLSQLEKMFPIVQKYGVEMPDLRVKQMQTLWGSCSRKYQTINLNYYLYKAPVACVEYVILHELLHFIYPKHDKAFCETLTVLMPDWQERKRLLDYEIVLGV